MEQLKLDLSEVEKLRNKDIDEDVLNSLNDEPDEEANLVYKKRLKNLIKDIAEYDDFLGVQAGKQAMTRLQETSKYLITMLILETLDELKNNNRKKIKPNDIDNALDKILAKASGIDTALEMLNKDIDTLKALNKSTSVSKATNFINNGW